jgi:hypothetical protein
MGLKHTFILLGALLLVSACGLPINQMTAAERKADMSWAFATFHHNYAPIELKKNNFGVEISEVEASCVELAEEDMTNQEFLSLFHRCIRLFQDAHVGAQQMNQGLLPEYAQVAHLGFLTSRTKYNGQEALRIVMQLKGADNSGAPLVPGDLIIGVNGMTVREYLSQELFPYVNVGQSETNLSIAALRFGVRTSIDMALPQDDEITLQVVRGQQNFPITLPWINEDMLEFQLRQNPPEEENQIDEFREDLEQILTEGTLLNVMNSLSQSFFGYEELKWVFDFLENPAQVVTNRVQALLSRGFRAAKFNPVMNSLLKEMGVSAQGVGLRTRLFPSATKVDDLMSEPLFTAKAITMEGGDVYAYIQLTSFPAEDKILTEWFRAITAIEDKEIKSVVIDLIDNGGGSLVHGMRILNMIRQRPIDYPSLQVRLNNNWMTSFKTQAAFGSDDYTKAIARRIVRDLEADKEAGRSLSRPISVTSLDPFFLQNPAYGLPDDVNIAILVNEFCVSMCDIFASVVQENNLATVIGQRTMGGGGNVVQHGLSPISKMGLALTESLVISGKGKYIEDEGVEPDIYVDMVLDRDNGFQEALKKALEVIKMPTDEEGEADETLAQY